MRVFTSLCFLLVFFVSNAQSIEVKWNVTSVLDDVYELGIEKGFDNRQTIQFSGGIYDKTENVIATTGFKLEFQYRFYVKNSKETNYEVNTTDTKQKHYFKNPEKNRDFGMNLFHVNDGLFFAPLINTFHLKNEREKFTSYGAGGILGYKIHKKRLFLEIFGGAGYYFVDNESDIFKEGVNPIYGLAVGAIL